jgi:hypothetical protein
MAGISEYKIRKITWIASVDPNGHRLLRDLEKILRVPQTVEPRTSAFCTGETVILNDTTQTFLLEGLATNVYPAILPKGIWRLSNVAKDGCEEFIIKSNAIHDSERIPPVVFSSDDLRVAEEITIYETAQHVFDWRISKARPFIESHGSPKLQVTPHLRNHPLKLST